jgi:hypothetical protein
MLEYNTTQSLRFLVTLDPLPSTYCTSHTLSIKGLSKILWMSLAERDSRYCFVLRIYPVQMSIRKPFTLKEVHRGFSDL